MDAKRQSLSALEAESRLKVEQVIALTGMGRTKIYNEVREGTFPQPERRGARCTRWRAGDVVDWLKATSGGTRASNVAA